MKTVYSEQHRLHFPKGELYGGELVRPFECPERWDYIVEALRSRGFTEFLQPGEFDVDLVQQVHAPDFLEFLATAWDLWTEEGMKGDAIPTCFPARRMQNNRVPNHIDGKLGYYAMAIETAIMSGTWVAAQSAAACAVTAQKLVADDGVGFALCRPPGHHAAADMYGGYCFMNNAAIARRVSFVTVPAGLRCWTLIFITATGLRIFFTCAMMCSTFRCMDSRKMPFRTLPGMPTKSEKVQVEISISTTRCLPTLNLQSGLVR